MGSVSISMGWESAVTFYFDANCARGWRQVEAPGWVAGGGFANTWRIQGDHGGEGVFIFPYGPGRCLTDWTG